MRLRLSRTFLWRIVWSGVLSLVAASDARSAAWTGDPAWSGSIAGWRTAVVIAVGAAVGVLMVRLIGRLRWRALRVHARRIDARVRGRTARLERAHAAKGEFVAQLSHEIRNPLNGMIGASLALEAGTLTPEQREHAGIVRTCATHLSSLVEGVLDLAEVETRTPDHASDDYDPRAVLGAVALMLAGQAEKAGVRLGVVVEESVPRGVRGNPGRVRQVLLNFAGNAIKFAPGGPVELRVQGNDGHLLFSVADRGPGIRDADKPRLFVPFSRLATARHAGVDGRGLGLAISQTIARRMGGAVGMMDREGGGSVFWLRVALEPVAPDSERVSGPGLARGFVGAVALVLEDADYNAATLEFMLKRMGLVCARARSGDEALAMLRERSYDWVFVDHDLPGMDGAEFVRVAKTVPGTAMTPVFIATTGSNTAKIREACRRSGMDAFVVKPITPESLRRALLAFAEPLRAGPSVHLPAAAAGPPDNILDYLGGGTEEGRRSSRAHFAAALDESVRQLEAAVQTRRRADLRRAAHHMVAQSRMIGAESLAAFAEQLDGGAETMPEPELAVLTDRISRMGRTIAADMRGPAPMHEPG